MALLCGWDPISFLRLSGDEQTVAVEVLRHAQAMRVTEMAGQAKAVGYYAAEALGRMFPR